MYIYIYLSFSSFRIMCLYFFSPFSLCSLVWIIFIHVSLMSVFFSAISKLLLNPFRGFFIVFILFNSKNLHLANSYHLCFSIESPHFLNHHHLILKKSLYVVSVTSLIVLIIASLKSLLNAICGPIRSEFILIALFSDHGSNFSVSLCVSLQIEYNDTFKNGRRMLIAYAENKFLTFQ